MEGDSSQSVHTETFVTLKIPALAGRDAPNNIAIFRLVALQGPLNKYDIYKDLPGRKEEKNYATISRRVDGLVARGYLTVTGSKIVREGTRREQEVNVYGLTWRGLIAALSQEEVLADIVAVLERHEKSLQFPGRDIAMKVVARWPEEVRHDTRLFWTSFLNVIPNDIEEIPQEMYAGYLFPSLRVLGGSILLQKMEKERQLIPELLKDPTIREWARRETMKILQQLESQLEAFRKLAVFLGVKVE
jgi:hypothetical protein